MLGTHDEARLHEALEVVLKESAGLRLPQLEPSVLVARLHAVCARFHDRPHLTPQELLAFAQGERFEPAFRNLLLETFSVKDTAFFRNKEIFAFLAEELQKKSAHKTQTVWCCASATGQEAFSLVMAWHKRLLQEEGEETASEETGARATRLVVYASDLSARAVETARAGVYNNFDVQHGMSVHNLLHFFEEQPGGGFWKAKDALLSHVTFFQHNLLRSPPSFLPRCLDAILLPHTLHHFHDSVAERILVRLATLLAPDGWLALAPDEADKYGALFTGKKPSFGSSLSPQGLLPRAAFACPDRGAARAAMSCADEEDNNSEHHDDGRSLRQGWHALRLGAGDSARHRFFFTWRLFSLSDGTFGSRQDFSFTPDVFGDTPFQRQYPCLR